MVASVVIPEIPVPETFSQPPSSRSAAFSGVDDGTIPDDGIGELTAGLVAGCDDAYREFHGRYHDRVWRYLIVVCRGDEHAAREAVQDTWVRVSKNARRFQAEADLWRWLAALARSAAFDGARRRTRYQGALSRFEASLPQDSEAAGPTQADPMDRLEGLLDEGLGRLSETDRQLLIGRYREGRSVRELAAQHDLSEKAMESKLGRLRAALKVELLRRLTDENAT